MHTHPSSEKRDDEANDVPPTPPDEPTPPPVKDPPAEAVEPPYVVRAVLERRAPDAAGVQQTNDAQKGRTMTADRKERRGFASMSPEKQREIASKGGRAAHQKGTAHEWTSEEARSAGRKGGQISRGGRGRLIEPAHAQQEPQPENTPAEAGIYEGQH